MQCNSDRRNLLMPLTEMGIKVTFTSPYHPQSNLVERIHADMVRLFRVLCGQKHKDWIKHLGEIVYLLNHTISATIGISPAEIFMNDRDIESLEEHFGVELESREDRYDQSHLLTIVNVRRKQKAEARRKQREEEQIGKRMIKEGDLVFVLQHNISSNIQERVGKFMNIYRGPYWCGKQKGLKTFELWDAMTGQYYGYQNTENLKLWTPTTETRKRWIKKIETVVDPNILTELKIESRVITDSETESVNT